MLEHGADRKEVAPEDGEKPEPVAERKELESSPERSVEEAEAFSKEIESMPQELRRRSAERVDDILAEADIEPGERWEIEGLEDAAKELAAAQRDADLLTAQTDRKLRTGPLAKLKRLAAASLAAMTMAGAAVPEARGEAPPPPSATATERPERRETLETKRPTPEKVKTDALDALSKDAALKAQVGPENMKSIEEAVRWFDQRKIDETVAGLAGIDPARLSAEAAREIRVYSEEEIESVRKNENKYFFMNSATAETRSDRILLRASKLVDAQGRVSVAAVEETIVHEQMHVYSTQGDSDQSRWEPRGVSSGVYEGVTELLAQRATGMTSPEQAYPGGNLASAYLLEKLVGTKALAADYLSGELSSVTAALKAKVGEAGTVEILQKKFDGAMAALTGAPEGLATAFEIAAQCRKAGIDIAPFLRQARAEGLKEHMTMTDKGDGMMLMKERGGKLMFTGLVEDGVRISPHSPPLRIAFSMTRGERAGKISEFLPGLLSKVAEYAEAGYKDFAATSKDPEHDPEWKRRAASTYPEFNITLNVGAELSELVKAREAATDPLVQDRLESEIADRSAQAAREFMVAVRTAAKGKKK